jgi:hypothetical protein
MIQRRDIEWRLSINLEFQASINININIRVLIGRQQQERCGVA